jgi:hypothetical protein
VWCFFTSWKALSWVSAKLKDFLSLVALVTSVKGENKAYLCFHHGSYLLCPRMSAIAFRSLELLAVKSLSPSKEVGKFRLLSPDILSIETLASQKLIFQFSWLEMNGSVNFKDILYFVPNLPVFVVCETLFETFRS